MVGESDIKDVNSKWTTNISIFQIILKNKKTEKSTTKPTGWYVVDDVNHANNRRRAKFILAFGSGKLKQSSSPDEYPMIHVHTYIPPLHCIARNGAVKTQFCYKKRSHWLILFTF